MKLVSLHCANGDHSWDRPSQRGRPPFNCPKHSSDNSTVIEEVITKVEESSNPLTSVLTGKDLAEHLYQSMQMLMTKTNREVISH